MLFCGADNPVTEHLELIGLDDDEKLVYLFLEKKGESTAGSIKESTALPEDRVKIALERLKEKGLIISAGKSPGKYMPRYRDPAFSADKGYMYYI